MMINLAVVFDGFFSERIVEFYRIERFVQRQTKPGTSILLAKITGMRPIAQKSLPNFLCY